MRGFNLAEQGHIVQMLQPDAYAAATGTSTLTSDVFSMENWSRAGIIIMLGTVADSLTLTVLESTSSSSGDGTAIAFSLYVEEDTGGDVIDSLVAASASGYVLGGTAQTFYIADIKATELTDGSEWVLIQIAGVGTAGDDISAVAVLTGGRHQRRLSATVIS